ncbi:swi5-dependent recombination DNA repair protein 1 homolog isoform X3 [Phaenicophaeus curvirostris]|uniref:swi5-dependent recombination DNA repair protein 1 homolog isoform X3 n=1 Tax=Phaenicophaeus curvirostris TaxID=33595 RepID=UPI0037F09DA8
MEEPSLCNTPKNSGTPAPQVAKRLKIDTEEKDCGDANEGCVPKTSTECSRVQDGSENLERNGTGHTCFKNPLQESDLCGEAENSHVPQTDLSQQPPLEEKARLLKQVQEKEELLRRLKMVKMYRSKNNLSELQALIVKWRNSTQLMLYELQSAFSADGKKVSLTQLIDSFGLEDQLLHYSRTEEDFVDA